MMIINLPKEKQTNLSQQWSVLLACVRIHPFKTALAARATLSWKYIFFEKHDKICFFKILVFTYRHVTFTSLRIDWLNMHYFVYFISSYLILWIFPPLPDRIPATSHRLTPLVGKIKTIYITFKRPRKKFSHFQQHTYGRYEFHFEFLPLVW